MMNSRSAPLMRSDGKQQALRGSRIAIAVGIGIILGCIFGFAYPNGFFFHGAYDHSILGDGKGCAFQERRINLLKSELSSLTENNERLKKQVKGMQSKLRELAVQKIKENNLAGEIDGGDKSPAVVAGPFGTVKSVRTNPTVVANSTVNPRLATILEEVAVNNELIVALASYNVKEMLTEWFTSIKKTGIPNYLVVALDDDTESYCKAENVPVYRRNKDDAVDSVAKGGSNHAISGLKFRILREFLQLGYGVLLSDIDIVYFKNPFDYLYRDCDVESMSDGHNNQTAYGYNDVSDDPAMGWARFAHTMRIWVYNSGFFYIRPTIPSIELLDRVATRLTNDHTLWDQAVFNEELTFPSSPGYVGLHASRRTMDIYVFMNSKVLFKYLRKEPRFSTIRPAVVHINYHPNKYVRMKAVVDYYVNGNKKALDVFPDGSE